MKDKRVLIISSEVVPYLPQTDQAIKSFQIPKTVNENGGQTRIFMPRYGLINERRHQLHEVIRLSGMNLVINDMDMPLIIKVASIPKERMQVYFIDNEEYFKRRAILHDSAGKIFKDNDERMIFFTKGVIETVKKLNWSPDIIHLHGWFTSLFPLYLKSYYADEPLFLESKIVYSVYEPDFKGTNHIYPDNIQNFKNFFDVMFMINSIEHLISFNDDFQSLDSAMKDSSTLIIETPNFRSLDLLFFKKYWGGLHQPRHTFLWTKKSLVEHLALWNYSAKFFKSP